MDLKEQIQSTCRERGMRITRQRMAVIHALTQADRPQSAEDICSNCKEEKVDLVTAYRTFDLLDELGYLQRVMLENGHQLFEIVPKDEHFHHIICRCCHKTWPINQCLGHALEETAAQYGLQKITHQLEVYGLCEECAQAA